MNEIAASSEDRLYSSVRKDLDDLDPTDDHRTGHYSARQIADACHARGGCDHE